MTTNAYRMTITIPPSVKEQMDQIKEQVNWSAVAAEAFQRKVVEIRTRRTKTMTKAKLVERLRAAGEADPKGFEAGSDHGRKWAEEKAIPRYLRNLAKNQKEAFEEYRGDDEERAHLSLRLAWAVTSGDRNWKMIWTDALGTSEFFMDEEDFARGFVAGALEAWEEVKDEL
jgi:hypothetical protein